MTAAPDWQPLLKETQFRGFLKEGLEIYFRKKAKVNYAEFSRKAGFSSRSYLSELLSGKKGLSTMALKQIKSTLKLPKELSQVLELLAYANFPELRPSDLAADEISNRILLSKKAFLKKQELNSLSAEARKKIIQSPTLYQVFAALGTLETGASLKEIQNRTQLTDTLIERQLGILKEFKLLQEKNFRFYPVSDQMDFFGLSKEDGLCSLIQSAAQDLQKNVISSIQDPHNLTFYSALSVDAEQLPAMRKKLQEAIYGVLDEFQNDQGSTVRQMLVSFRST